MPEIDIVFVQMIQMFVLIVWIQLFGLTVEINKIYQCFPLVTHPINKVLTTMTWLVDSVLSGTHIEHT